MHILTAKNLSKNVPGKTLFDQVNFKIGSGDKVGLIAKNGTGKSTLLKIIAGVEESDSGDLLFAPHIRVAYLAQSQGFDPEATVIDILFSHNSEIGQVIKRYEQVLASDNHDELPQIVQQIDELQGRDYETKVNIVINKLKLNDLLDQTIKQCSGGEIKRLALARLLIEESDFLLLDEPTNHLDMDMIERLETYLNRYANTILMVTHDRYFLERICDNILELDHGNLYSYQGNYYKFLEQKQLREENEALDRHQLKQVLKKELERMRKAPRARENKSALRTKKFLEIERQYKLVKHQECETSKKIEIQVDERRIGGKILRINNLFKSYGSKKLIENFSYDFRAGERVGIVGRNGVGKTTLVRMLMGDEPADSGKISKGDTITMALYEQKQQLIDEEKRVIDVVRDVSEYINIGGGKRISASKLLEYFLFPMHQQRQRAYTLSGGEKRRLHLLTTLIANPNFLILDEPTNDLDVMTLTILEDFLTMYKGCLLVISHDRYFMDKVVDHILVFDGDGVINDFPGSYSDRKESLEDVTPEITKEPEVSKIETQIPKPRKGLNNKEREEYKFLFEEIERLEGQKDDINLKLAGEGLDHKQIKGLSFELSKVVTKLEKYETRWYELGQRT